MSITLEEANIKIGKIAEKVQAVVAKGWRCGETHMPLAADHQQRLVAEAQAKADTIAKEVTT